MKHCHFQGHDWRIKSAITPSGMVTVKVCTKCGQSRTCPKCHGIGRMPQNGFDAPCDNPDCPADKDR